MAIGACRDRVGADGLACTAQVPQPATDLLPTGGLELDQCVPRPCESESTGGRNTMMRSLYRVRTRVAYPTVLHECGEARESGHEAGRDLVGSHGDAPCQAEQILELVGRDGRILRCQVHQGTQRRQQHEFGSGFIAPQAVVGWTSEPNSWKMQRSIWSMVWLPRPWPWWQPRQQPRSDRPNRGGPETSGSAGNGWCDPQRP